MDIIESMDVQRAINQSVLAISDDHNPDPNHKHTIFTPEFYAHLYTGMFVVSIVVFSIEGIAQVVCSVLFLKKTWQIKEVTWWLKVLCFVPNISWVCYITLWYFFLTKDLNGVTQGVCNMVSKVSLIFNFGHLIRMVRV